MIQYMIKDTYPTYEITFFKEAMKVVTIHNVDEDDIDHTIYDFGDEDKEQIFTVWN